jgi:GT2 family glycosyltransferase
VIALPENRGFAAAVNAGLERVTEPYAFILNTDITLENDAFTLLIKALTQDPRAALACPLLLRPDGSVQASAVPEPRLWWELLNRALPRHFIRLAPDEPTAVPGVVGPCMAIDVQRMATVGRMDERFFFFMEETDWCRRIRRAGLHILYVPSARVVHLQGASANRRPIKARIQFYDSRYRYFRKHTGRLGVGVLYLGLWLRLTLDLLLHSLLCALTLGRQRHRDRVAVYAALWGWHALLCRPRWGIDPRPLR